MKGKPVLRSLGTILGRSNVEHFSYRIGSYSKLIGRPPVFVNSMDLIPRGFQYASIYAVPEETARAIEQAGTAAGFKGVVWSQRLWLDFDTQDAAERAKAQLKEQGYDHVVYTTGGRGCHIGVLRRAVPSHTLPAQDRAYAQAHFPGCDLSIYWHLHLLRLPGAIHERTGKVKQFLYRLEGKELELPRWEPQELAVRPDVAGQSRGGVFKLWSVVSRLSVEPAEGDRHRHLVALAKALQADAAVTEQECLWMVQEVNRGFPVPKGEDEIARIVKWAYGAGE
jgi:hypothetical protein